MKLSTMPSRAAAGAFILHSGLDKWKGDEETATRIHGFAAGAFPLIKQLPPKNFLRLLSAGEIGLGAALLVPLVPDRLAGAGLSAFSGALIALYARTPGMRKPNSIWPTPQGIALSKDIWMLGIGASLLLED